MYRMVSSPCGEYGNGARDIQDAIFLIVSIPGDDATLNLHNLLALCFSRIHCQIKREVAREYSWITKEVDKVEYLSSGISKVDSRKGFNALNVLSIFSRNLIIIGYIA